MNIGDYVRTKDGIIAKCIKEECDRYVFDKIIVEDGYYKDYEYKDVTPKGSYILKSSSNIIDLIEVGDYVNGSKVYHKVRTDIDDYGNNFKEVGVESDRYLYHWVEEKDIKSIVTKEQFESMKYEVK